MNIVVCDDQLDYQNLIVRKIYECFHEKDITLNVYQYSEISDLIESVEEHSYQFAFIEMDVKGGKGIEAAKSLQRVNPACRIVFISHKYKRVHEAFQVQAMEYLLKPIDTNVFQSVFTYILQWYRDQDIKFVIPIRDMKRKKIFNVNDIKFVETYYNDVEIVTMDNKRYMAHVKNRYKLRTALRFRWFLQINQSVLVNMKCIDFLTDRNVILKSREVFPLSKKTLVRNHLAYDVYLNYLEQKKRERGE